MTDDLSASLSPEPHDRQSLLEQLHRTQLAYRMAAEMSQFKAGFLARISHELRAPLNSLIGLQQLILNDLCDSPEEEREFISQAHTASLKMVKLIDEILSVSRAECGRDRLHVQPLNLAEILESVHQLTHLQAANRNLQLEILPPQTDLYVLADRRWLQQVLVNLVDTSIRLMADLGEGRIRVETQLDPQSDQVKIWIEDQRPASSWSEPLALMETQQSGPSDALTAPGSGSDSIPDDLPDTMSQFPNGLTLAINQTILEFMQGSLEVLAVPNAPAPSTSDLPAVTSEPPLTRLQCSLPFAAVDTNSTA